MADKRMGNESQPDDAGRSRLSAHRLLSCMAVGGIIATFNIALVALWSLAVGDWSTIESMAPVVALLAVAGMAGGAAYAVGAALLPRGRIGYYSSWVVASWTTLTVVVLPTVVMLQRARPSEWVQAREAVLEPSFIALVVVSTTLIGLLIGRWFRRYFS